MKSKNKLLNVIKENNLMIALSNYQRASAYLNKVDIEWLKLSVNDDAKTEYSEKQFNSSLDSAYGHMVDALSVLTYLYDIDGLTYSGKSVVRGIFKFCMSKKDLRPIIKRACKKNKYSSLRNLYKKYKKKVKVS